MLGLNAQVFTGVCSIVAMLAAFTCANPAEATTANHYGVTISTNPTQNMTFNNGVYTATGGGANLNVTDLENALATGNLKVSTGNGIGGGEKGDLHVDAGFSWAGAHALTLDAYHSVFVSAVIADMGKGSLALTASDGGFDGAIIYAETGNITIANLQNKLVINGERFLLDGSVKSLAGDIRAKPDGRYALVNSYDASQDGTYTTPPVSTTFTGSFDGMGNTISNLKIDAPTADAPYIGLFQEVSGTIRNLHLTNVSVASSHGTYSVGALVGYDHGPIENVTVSGTIQALSGSQFIGGLVGVSNGSVMNCSSSATVFNGGFGDAGGLAGVAMTLTDSFSTGSVSVKHRGYVGGIASIAGTISSTFTTGSISGGDKATVGGLVGLLPGGYIVNSYSKAAVMGGLQATTGGLIGELGKQTSPTIITSYSIGSVSGGPQSWIGGLVGFDGSNGQTGCGCFTDSYWDTDTSGVTDPSQGSGNIPNESGITGLTTEQLTSGLPTGFDPAIWAEKRKIDHHLPYLIQNPPPR